MFIGGKKFNGEILREALNFSFLEDRSFDRDFAIPEIKSS